jgi:gamma-glutamyltranspeptidase/glutathione hydrolase
MKHYIKLLVFLCGVVFGNTPIAATRGMVVTEHHLASQVGVDILRGGGNAIDAAVAVGYALAVVNPCCGNIGGGGFMLVHLANGKDIFINFREKAPMLATKNMFQHHSSTKGFLAVGIPGTVMGLDAARRKYGTLSRKQVMMPAIQLAKQGFIVSPYLAKQFQTKTDTFKSDPSVAAIFLRQGKPYVAGERLVQRDLAHTLTLIAEKGPDVFYRGSIANAIVSASRAHGGVLTREDFLRYTIEELTPIRCHYHGYTIISAPPPSSGGVILCEMLQVLEHFSLSDMGYRSARSVRVIVETMRRGYADRNNKLGDPNFVKNPIDELLSPTYAKEISDKIKYSTHLEETEKTIRVPEQTDTTHYSVYDSQGNAVSVTYTLNNFFGAGVMAPQTGFFLNNEMDDFAAKVASPNKFGLIQSDMNAVQAGKRPLSSMTPTLILKNNQVMVILGSPGGPRIISAVLLTILHLLDDGFSIQQAVNAPRFHFQGEPNTLFVEPRTLSLMTATRLKWMGYPITQQSGWAAVEAIFIDPHTHSVEGANDIRRPDGAAIGY